MGFGADYLAAKQAAIAAGQPTTGIAQSLMGQGATTTPTLDSYQAGYGPTTTYVSPLQQAAASLQTTGQMPQTYGFDSSGNLLDPQASGQQSYQATPSTLLSMTNAGQIPLSKVYDSVTGLQTGGEGANYNTAHDLWSQNNMGLDWNTYGSKYAAGGAGGVTNYVNTLNDSKKYEANKYWNSLPEGKGYLNYDSFVNAYMSGGESAADAYAANAKTAFNNYWNTNKSLPTDLNSLFTTTGTAAPTMIGELDDVMGSTQDYVIGSDNNLYTKTAGGDYQLSTLTSADPTKDQSTFNMQYDPTKNMGFFQIPGLDTPTYFTGTSNIFKTSTPATDDTTTTTDTSKTGGGTTTTDTSKTGSTTTVTDPYTWNSGGQGTLVTPITPGTQKYDTGTIAGASSDAAKAYKPDAFNIDYATDPSSGLNWQSTLKTNLGLTDDEIYTKLNEGASAGKSMSQVAYELGLNPGEIQALYNTAQSYAAENDKGSFTFNPFPDEFKDAYTYGMYGVDTPKTGFMIPNEDGEEELTVNPLKYWMDQLSGNGTYTTGDDPTEYNESKGYEFGDYGYKLPTSIVDRTSNLFNALSSIDNSDLFGSAWTDTGLQGKSSLDKLSSQAAQSLYDMLYATDDQWKSGEFKSMPDLSALDDTLEFPLKDYLASRWNTQYDNAADSGYQMLSNNASQDMRLAELLDLFQASVDDETTLDKLNGINDDYAPWASVNSDARQAIQWMLSEPNKGFRLPGKMTATQFWNAIPGDTTYTAGSNKLPQEYYLRKLFKGIGVSGFAEGGRVGGLSGVCGDPVIHRYIKGGTVQGGQADNIPAMLSENEYVFDADTVAALGDGNPDAGAAKLDKMRENIRRHKRSAPASKIPPRAKAPEQYLTKGKKNG